MKTILGIDAAWTAKQPSGVALLVVQRDRLVCKALAPSYRDFLELAGGRPVDWTAPAGGEQPPMREVVLAATSLAAAIPSVVALDLPLARGPILGRRVADSRISQLFGARGCSTHSPGPERPGPISARVRDDLAGLGYQLATADGRKPDELSLLEVYPHTALLALLGADYRLPYKLSRARRYWPEQSPDERRTSLRRECQRILRALRQEIADIDLPLPTHGSGRERKAAEDALDALVCAWVGARFLAGEAVPHGDEAAAIWTPADRPAGDRVPP